MKPSAPDSAIRDLMLQHAASHHRLTRQAPAPGLLSAVCHTCGTGIQSQYLCSTASPEDACVSTAAVCLTLALSVFQLQEEALADIPAVFENLQFSSCRRKRS